ncbi:mannitol dehydrogenase rossman domain family [Tribonema minus]|uniref:mannitol 2-dehydrogenase n=1 Tax=Tribonema minus TaxID=303371 RepID=A0A835ZLG9_9STRA|nr:mannitol dehydrogenase rossman domain family [Tribonema minus]
MPTMQATDSVDALNLINSSQIGQLYSSTNTEDPLVLRKKAADFRKGYKNWRQKKPKGARGETNYLLDKEKQHAHDVVTAEEQMVLEAQEELGAFMEPHMTRSDSMELRASLEQLSRKESVRERGSGSIPRGAAATPDAHHASIGSMTRTRSFHGEDDFIHDDERENWLKFYVNPFAGMAEASATEPVELTQAALKVLPPSVLKPAYARPVAKAYVDKYICHMGVGGFHRSHQCVYTDDLLNAQGSGGVRWGFCGIGLMDWDRKMYDTLKKQDYLYTVLSRSSKTNEARVIGSIVDFVFAPDDHQHCIDRLADPSTCIVSLTVTEKGYCQNSEGDLDTENPFVRADLDGNLAKPKTAIGMIVAALRQRRAKGVPSFTVLSCDNLPENGDKAKHCAWISANTTFPNTMVDRITPMTEQEHKDILARDHLILDGWPVIAEDFMQWVVENDFCLGCPEWDKVGVLMVNDVRPYEFMKLRLLNGGHSALSYMSILCGYTYVDDAMANADIAAYIGRLFHEVVPTLMSVPGVSAPEYCDKLIERFSNPYIKDKLMRLAEDGSKKMQNTMRDAILELQKRGLSTKVLALANAAWIRYCVGKDENGDPLEIKDPMAAALTKLAEHALADVKNPDPTEFLRQVHGQDLAACAGFVGEVKGHLRSMMSIGSKATLQAVIEAGANGTGGSGSNGNGVNGNGANGNGTNRNSANGNGTNGNGTHGAGAH